MEDATVQAYTTAHACVGRNTMLQQPNICKRSVKGLEVAIVVLQQ